MLTSLSNLANTGKTQYKYLNQSEAGRTNQHKYKEITKTPPFMKVVSRHCAFVKIKDGA